MPVTHGPWAICSVGSRANNEVLANNGVLWQGLGAAAQQPWTLRGEEELYVLLLEAVVWQGEALPQDCLKEIIFLSVAGDSVVEKCTLK